MKYNDIKIEEARRHLAELILKTQYAQTEWMTLLKFANDENWQHFCIDFFDETMDYTKELLVDVSKRLILLDNVVKSGMNNE